MIYLLIIIILSILVYCYDYSGKIKNKTFWFILCLVIFVSVTGFRYRLGVDSIRYESAYSFFPKINELFSYDYSTSRYGIGYIIFASIPRTISDDFVSLQLLQSLFVNCSVFFFFRKYCSHPFSCILIYFLVLYFNFNCEVMREACAVSILLLAWPYFIKKNWIKYYILAIFSCFFHISGCITLLLPILYLPGISSIFIVKVKLVITLIVIYIIGTIVSVKFFNYIQAIAIFDSIQAGVDMYSNSELGGNILNIGGIISTIIKYILYPFIGIIILKNYFPTKSPLSLNKNAFQSFEFMTVLCFVFAILSIPIAILYRYTNYFFPFAIVMMCEWLFRHLRMNNRVLRMSFGIYLLILIPYFIWQMYALTKINPENNLREIYRYYPYSSIIDQSISKDRERLYNFYGAE